MTYDDMSCSIIRYEASKIKNGKPISSEDLELIKGSCEKVLNEGGVDGDLIYSAAVVLAQGVNGYRIPDNCPGIQWECKAHYLVEAHRDNGRILPDIAKQIWKKHRRPICHCVCQVNSMECFRSSSTDPREAETVIHAGGCHDTAQVSGSGH